MHMQMHSLLPILLPLALSQIQSTASIPLHRFTPSKGTLPRGIDERRWTSVAHAISLLETRAVDDTDAGSGSSGFSALASQFLLDVEAAVRAGDEEGLEGIAGDFEAAMGRTGSDGADDSDGCGGEVAEDGSTTPIFSLASTSSLSSHAIKAISAAPTPIPDSKTTSTVWNTVTDTTTVPWSSASASAAEPSSSGVPDGEALVSPSGGATAGSTGTASRHHRQSSGTVAAGGTKTTGGSPSSSVGASTGSPAFTHPVTSAPAGSPTTPTPATSAPPASSAPPTTTYASTAPAWQSGVYKQVATTYSGRNGTIIKNKAGIALAGSSGDDWASWEAVEGNVLGWGYNWSPSVPDSFPTSSLEFVPELWSAASESALSKGLANDFGGIGVTSILSFNEPDNGGQANLSPAAAATAHQKVFTEEVAAKYRIGAPAVQFGGEKWFKEWLDACEGKCLFDFVPLHTYFTDLPTIQKYVEHVNADIGLNVWIDEYACMNWVNGKVVYCSPDEQTTFTEDFNKWAYKTEYIERYSQFGAFKDTATPEPIGLMNTDGSPNALGKAFITAN